MAEGSPLPFPSPSVILGESAAPSPPNAAPPKPPPPTTTTEPPRRQKHVRSPSKKDNSKKAAPKKTPAVENGGPSGAGPDAVKDASVVKPKQTKSRNGCATCKLKRLKCGEEKPACTNCIKRGVQCGGYKKTFQWRDYGNAQVKTNVSNQKQATARISPVRNTGSAGSSKPTTPTSEVPPVIHQAPTSQPHATQRRPIKVPTPPNRNGTRDDRSAAQKAAGSLSPMKDEHRRQDSAITPPGGAQQSNQRPASAADGRDPDAAAPAEQAIRFDSNSHFVYRTRSLSPGDARGPSPSLTEMLFSEMPSEVQSDRPSPQDFVPFSMPDDMQLPLWSAGSQGLPSMNDEDLFGHGDFDIIGPIQPIDVQPFLWPSRYQPSHSPGSSVTMSDFGLWSGGSPLYLQPGQPFDSVESLVVRYEKITCGVLSVVDGQHENPWRTLVWPMAQESTALYHALLAMTAFHAAHDDHRYKVVAHQHKELAIQNISEGLRNDTIFKHCAIATALALSFAEAWDSLTNTGNAHIKGAQALVKNALELHRRNPHHGIHLHRLKFLCNAWVYMDVIARLTCVDNDDESQFEMALWPHDPPELAMGNDTPGFGIDLGMPIDARLDPLMGCAGTLFPLIGHVANLVRKVCRSKRNPIGVISTARDLMESLEKWEPPAYIEKPEDPTTNVQHAVQTAEAYRYATMLHLHQSVPELPTPLSDEQYAQRVLQYLATVPLSSRTLNVHIYPLMVSGCQAMESDDREWVRQRWDRMFLRMRLGIIDKCKAITEEVWRRRDIYEASPPEHRRLVATADTQRERPRGAPLDRAASDVANVNPGNTGVVFSYEHLEGSKSPPSHNEINRGEMSRGEMSRPGSSRPPRNNQHEFAMGKFDPAYTVRGHLHWVGVMWDWCWEVLL